ncbi:MAG: hypothetical protein L6Q97_14045 [Thermoanaerobaculia bacterium]|nr:hypothetical protein [Thermoanaerobaculia bacterium]
MVFVNGVNRFEKSPSKQPGFLFCLTIVDFLFVKIKQNKSDRRSKAIKAGPLKPVVRMKAGIFNRQDDNYS